MNDQECPECERSTLTRTAGPLPVCAACDWTGWPDDGATDQRDDGADSQSCK